MFLSAEDFEVELQSKEEIERKRTLAQEEIDEVVGWGGPDVEFGEDESGRTMISVRHCIFSNYHVTPCVFQSFNHRCFFQQIDRQKCSSPIR